MQNAQTIRLPTVVNKRRYSVENKPKIHSIRSQARGPDRIIVPLQRELKFPLFVDGLDGPFELLPERLGEEFLNGNIKFLAEHNRETGINVVLQRVS